MKRRSNTAWLMSLVVSFALVACAADAEPEDASVGEMRSEPEQTEPPADVTPDEPPAEDAGDAVEPEAAAPPEADEAPVSEVLTNPLDPELHMMAPATFQARFTTTKGVFVVELHRDWAPNGVDRFFNLVRHGFYDGVKFFRVLDGFMAQFGIHRDPSIQQHWRTASLVDDPVIESNTRGRLTYANTGTPNSRSTQLFINFGDNSRLDNLRFTPIGEVVEGMDVVEQLYSGYGEGYPRGPGPDQAQIQMRGNEYLEADYPLLDAVERVEIVGGD